MPVRPHETGLGKTTIETHSRSHSQAYPRGYGDGPPGPRLAGRNPLESYTAKILPGAVLKAATACSGTRGNWWRRIQPGRRIAFKRLVGEGVTTAEFVGLVVGCLAAILILNVILYWALFRWVIRQPVVSRGVTAIAAWLAAGTIAGFGFADGGPFSWGGYSLYALPALIVGGLSIYLASRKPRAG